MELISLRVYCPFEVNSKGQAAVVSPASCHNPSGGHKRHPNTWDRWSIGWPEQFGRNNRPSGNVRLSSRRFAGYFCRQGLVGRVGQVGIIGKKVSSIGSGEG